MTLPSLGNAVRSSGCFGFLQEISPPIFSSFLTEKAGDRLLPKPYEGLFT